jgi:hypothetical protein
MLLHSNAYLARFWATDFVRRCDGALHCRRQYDFAVHSVPVVGMAGLRPAVTPMISFVLRRDDEAIMRRERLPSGRASLVAIDLAV